VADLLQRAGLDRLEAARREQRGGHGLAGGNGGTRGGSGDRDPAAPRRGGWRRETVATRGPHGRELNRAVGVVRLGAAWGAVARQDLPFST
jgi:hypothetical protein